MIINDTQYYYHVLRVKSDCLIALTWLVLVLMLPSRYPSSINQCGFKGSLISAKCHYTISNMQLLYTKHNIPRGPFTFRCAVGTILAFKQWRVVVATSKFALPNCRRDRMQEHRSAQILPTCLITLLPFLPTVNKRFTDTWKRNDCEERFVWLRFFVGSSAAALLWPIELWRRFVSLLVDLLGVNITLPTIVLH